MKVGGAAIGLSNYDKKRIEANFFEKMGKEGIDVTSGAMREELVLGALDKIKSKPIFKISGVNNCYVTAGFGGKPTVKTHWLVIDSVHIWYKQEDKNGVNK